ncbi:histidine--tRNA ligase [Candidatus Woesearchaeota archaeon]|nr:MAG: histidine--tRNA ligase [Candidatus Woesearchaeota archaeon]
MELRTAKGVRDTPPQLKLLQDRVVRTLKTLFERFGFAPLETPVIERFEVLASKYAGGEEILKECFQLTDQGGRKLGLRYDLTVPLARFVGMNPSLKMPFKRYQIGRVYRDGPIKLGRYREFYQCDCDIVGAGGLLAEAECLLLADEVFRSLGIDIRILVNDRRILDGLVQSCGILPELSSSVILSLDKVDKLGREEVKRELVQKGVAVSAADLLLDLTSPPGDNDQKLGILRSQLGENEGLANVASLLDLLGLANVEFSPGLARGLSYYTGTLFEVFATSGPITRSAIAAGGRYDRLIGDLLGAPANIPAIGISFGLEPILDILKSRAEDLPVTPAKVFVIPIQTVKESLSVVSRLRKAGVNASIDLNERGISANLKYANSLGIPFVVIVGEEELKQEKVQLKDMRSGESWVLSVEDAAKNVLG